MLLASLVSLTLVLQLESSAQADTSRLTPVRTALVNAVRQKDAVALAAVFTVDGVMARGNSGKNVPTAGSKAIEELWRTAFAGMNGPNPYRVQVGQILMGGERALEQGEFGPDGGPWVGTYILLYERQVDGNWRVAYWKFYTHPPEPKS